ncbi:MAG: WG repeat-containing protein, partial [Bacteroidaceae bacterium]|nr:WG repeat-containing protein [Bacteroidaceae bacterium]
ITMKRLTQIFQALLGVVALILTALIAAGRLAWRTIRNWWKKHSKWLRCSIVAIFIIVPVGFVALVAYALYEDEYGRDYWDRKLSDNITLHSFSDNKWRVYDKQTGEYTTDKIYWLSEVPESDSLAVYALPNKRGYINVNTGRIVIDAEANDYRKAWVFSEGLAAVMKEGKIGFINTNNEVVIPFQFDYTDKCCMYDFGYLFHDGYCIMTNKDGDLGLIDTTGKWIVEPAYDEIWAPHESGYRIIVDNSKHGVLDSRGNVVYPAEYGYIDVLSDGFVLTKGGKKWQVDFDGNVVQPFMFDGTYYLNYPIGYNECGDIQYAFADYAKYEVMNRYGIMNRITGKPITLALYSDINMLSKDLFEVQAPESYDWYLVDTQGNVVSKK